MSEEAPKPTDADTAAEIEELADQADSAATESRKADAPPEPLDPLEAALAEAAKWKDRAARGQAELDNYRKRMAREKTDAIKFANSGLLGDLLPVIDNFQMGLDAAKADGEDSTIARGMEMVQKQLDEFLSNNGAQEVAAVGLPFDPNVHEAIGQEHSDEVPEGHVIRQMRRGFKLHDRLLRAANVVVSKGP
jgi:molecular chaperone GrpE